MEKKYSALRTLATIYRVLGWIVIIFGALFSCGILAIGLTGTAVSGLAREGAQLGAAGLFSGIFGFIFGLIWTALVGLGLLAFADLIHVALDIEENTRVTMQQLKKPGA